jgi:hypothetical protein
MLRHHLRLVIFAIGLLVGVQVPGFIDQYDKRVNAHYIEAQRAFSGFQQTADRYFGGSVEQLIAHHSASGDRVFQDEAKTIAKLYARMKSLAAELDALRGTLFQRMVHVAIAPDQEILKETINAYSYTVPLNADAILCGVGAGFLLSFIIESLLVGGLSLLRREMFRATSTRSPPARRREPSLASDAGQRRRD